jgi:hypothetical protein
MSRSCSPLLPGQALLRRKVDVGGFNLLTLEPTIAHQLGQCMFRLNAKHFFQFPGVVAGIRTLYERLDSCQQVAEARKPGRAKAPQPLGAKARNGSERVVFSSMRIAADILQFIEFSEYRAACRVAQGRPKLLNRRDLVLAQECLECRQLVVGCFHNENISPSVRQAQGQCSHKHCADMKPSVRRYDWHSSIQDSNHNETISP